MMGEGQVKVKSQNFSDKSLTFVDKSLALVEKSLSLVYSKHVYYLLLPRVFSEADCGLLNFTRVNQELREDPELDNDWYSL